MVQISSLSLLAISSSFVKAQSSSSSSSSSATSCNPIEATDCAANPALATSFVEDFTKKSSWFPYQSGKGNITYGSDGVSLTLAQRFDNPALQSDFYIMYGKMEVELKASPGTGIVSTFYLQSDDLDEIDIEWIGSDNTQFQSNFFSKGNTSSYDRGAFHTVESPVDMFHNYTIDWGMAETTWALDGAVVRTLPNTSSDGYPQSPMFIKMGIWAGGDPSNAPGTIEWAGGEVDYSSAPFTMYIRRVIVTDYSTGKQYSYSDQSGSWESIVAKDGSVDGREEQAGNEYNDLANGGSISSASSSSTIVTHSTSASSSSSSSNQFLNSTTTGTVTSTSVGSTSMSESRSSSSSSTYSNTTNVRASSSSTASGSGSRSTLAPASTLSSQSSSTATADFALSGASGSASGSTTTSVTTSATGSLTGSAISSSTNGIQTASNAAAAIGFSQTSLPALAALVALLI